MPEIYFKSFAEHVTAIDAMLGTLAVASKEVTALAALFGEGSGLRPGKRHPAGRIVKFLQTAFPDVSQKQVRLHEMVADTLGAKNVHGVLMPSQFSSLHSVSDSIDLANNLEISTHLIPIDKIYNLMVFEMHNFLEKNKWSVAKENLQGRGGSLICYFRT